MNILPIDPETQTQGGPRRLSGQAYTLTVSATCPDERDAVTRRLWRVTIRPGLVMPGTFAAVRAPDGCLTLKRIHYEREGGREFVRLESLLPGIAALRYPLAGVTIEGTVISVRKEGEE
jgi:hypothetical protein